MSNFYAHSSAILDKGCQIGKGTKIWHFSHLMSGCQIGENCTIGQNVFIAEGVILGNNVKVQNNVSIYKGVKCEDDVFIGPSVVFTNVINPRSAVNRRSEFQPTLIKKGVSIGANATVVCGNTLERYAFIGAGTVVTKSVPAYGLVIGNPGKMIGWMSEKGHRLQFDESGTAQCSEDKSTYKLRGGKVFKETNKTYFA